MNKDNRGVRFIRVNGRVIPIRVKDPSKKKMKANYEKYGDGANQASKIDEKYIKKVAKETKGQQLLSLAGWGSLAYSLLLGKNSNSIHRATAGVIGLGAMGAALYSRYKVEKKYAPAKEREYVRAFGMTSSGIRPSKRKNRV